MHPPCRRPALLQSPQAQQRGGQRAAAQSTELQRRPQKGALWVQRRQRDG